MIFGKYVIELDSSVIISPGYRGDFLYQSAVLGKVYIGRMQYSYKRPVKSEQAYRNAYEQATRENNGISHKKADEYAQSQQIVGSAKVRGLREYYVNVRAYWDGRKWVLCEPRDTDITTNGLGILLKGKLVPIPQAQILYPGF